MYSFQLPEDISREELNKRADKLNTKVARLFDFAAHLITKCTVFFLKHMHDLSRQYSMEPWVVIEKILIDRKAQKDVFQKYWGPDPRAQLAMMLDENGPIIGEELYKALFNYYDQRERPNWENSIVSFDPNIPRDEEQTKMAHLVAHSQYLEREMKKHPEDLEAAKEYARWRELVNKELANFPDKTPEDYSYEIRKRRGKIARKDGEAKAAEYLKLITPLTKAHKYDEALAMWPWPK